MGKKIRIEINIYMTYLDESCLLILSLSIYSNTQTLHFIKLSLIPVILFSLKNKPPEQKLNS